MDESVTSGIRAVDPAARSTTLTSFYGGYPPTTDPYHLQATTPTNPPYPYQYHLNHYQQQPSPPPPPWPWPPLPPPWPLLPPQQQPSPPPPVYDFHNLHRCTIVLADSTVRSYFALPPDYNNIPPPPPGSFAPPPPPYYYPQFYPQQPHGESLPTQDQPLLSSAAAVELPPLLPPLSPLEKFQPPPSLPTFTPTRMQGSWLAVSEEEEKEDENHEVEFRPESRNATAEMGATTSPPQTPEMKAVPPPMPDSKDRAWEYQFETARQLFDEMPEQQSEAEFQVEFASQISNLKASLDSLGTDLLAQAKAWAGASRPATENQDQQPQFTPAAGRPGEQATYHEHYPQTQQPQNLSTTSDNGGNETGKSEEKKEQVEAAESQTPGSAKSLKKKIVRRVVKQKVGGKLASGNTAKESDNVGEKHNNEGEKENREAPGEEGSSPDPAEVKTSKRKVVVKKKTSAAKKGDKAEPSGGAAAEDTNAKTVVKKKAIKKVAKRKVADVELSKESDVDQDNVAANETESAQKKVKAVEKPAGKDSKSEVPEMQKKVVSSTTADSKDVKEDEKDEKRTGNKSGSAVGGNHCDFLMQENGHDSIVGGNSRAVNVIGNGLHALNLGNGHDIVAGNGHDASAGGNGHAAAFIEHGVHDVVHIDEKYHVSMVVEQTGKAFASVETKDHNVSLGENGHGPSVDRDVQNNMMEVNGHETTKEGNVDGSIGGDELKGLSAANHIVQQDTQTISNALHSATEIYGHEDIKKALLLLLVGSPHRKLKDGMTIRGDLHICLMGDPGVAKSQLIKHIINVAPRGVYTTGKGSNGVGLTVAVQKDPVTNEMVLEGGVLVLADMGICAIDEFDKMDELDRTTIHEVMEQQSVIIAKVGITTSVNARNVVLAAANPAWGRYDLRRTLAENINLPPALLSRFDLLWLILDRADMDSDLEMVRHIVYVHQNKASPALGFTPLEPSVLRAYISAARRLSPTVPPELEEYIASAYSAIRQEEAKSNAPHSYTTVRTLLSILRISAALARLRFSETVAQSDVDEFLRVSTSLVQTESFMRVSSVLVAKLEDELVSKEAVL